MTPEQWAHYQRLMDLTRDGDFVHANSGPGLYLPDLRRHQPPTTPGTSDPQGGLDTEISSDDEGTTG